MPNLEQAIQMIQEEEMWLMTLIEVNPCDSTAFVARYKDGKQQRPTIEGQETNPTQILLRFKRGDDKDNLFCTHCKKWRRTIDS